MRQVNEKAAYLAQSFLVPLFGDVGDHVQRILNAIRSTQTFGYVLFEGIVRQGVAPNIELCYWPRRVLPHVVKHELVRCRTNVTQPLNTHHFGLRLVDNNKTM